MSMRRICSICGRDKNRAGSYCLKCTNAYQRWRRQNPDVANPLHYFRQHLIERLRETGVQDVDVAVPYRQAGRPKAVYEWVDGNQSDVVDDDVSEVDVEETDVVPGTFVDGRYVDKDEDGVFVHPLGCGCWKCAGFKTYEDAKASGRG
jgi:hypothetical protein